MMDEVIDLPQGENLTSWRLGRVEKGIEQLNEKLDGMGEIKDTVIVHNEKIRSLEKSRDRLIIAFSGLSTGVIILGLQEVFSLLGKA